MVTPAPYRPTTRRATSYCGRTGLYPAASGYRRSQTACSMSARAARSPPTACRDERRGHNDPKGVEDEHDASHPSRRDCAHGITGVCRDRRLAAIWLHRTWTPREYAGDNPHSQDRAASCAAVECEHQPRPVSAESPAETPAAMDAHGIVHASGASGGLYAHHARTGTQLWKSGASSVPAVADGVVYAGSRDGNVYALDAETGAVRWKAPAGVVEAPISVVRGVVYAGTDDGHAVAIDARTGSIKWSSWAGSSRPVVSAPAVADGVAVARSEGGVLSAFDARTGASLWTTQQRGNDFTSQPVSIKGTVYITDDWYLYAFDTKTGQTSWQPPAGDMRSLSFVLVGGLFFFLVVGGWFVFFVVLFGL